MQFSAARRSGKTYGKANKSSLVHDLFEYRANPDEASATPSSRASPGLTSDSPFDAIPQDVAATGSKSQSPSTALYLSSFDFSDKKMASELKKSLIQDTSLFDIVSSDDGDSSDTSGSRASKRRRMLKPLGVTKPRSHDLSQSTRTTAAKMSMVQQKAKKVRYNQPAIPTVAVPSIETLTPTTTKKSTVNKVPIPQKQSLQQPVNKLLPMPRITRAKSPILLPSQFEDAQAAEQAGTDASEYLSDRSHPSATWDRPTPKRKKLSPVGTDSEVSSPSQLGLTALKLGKTSLTPAQLSSEPSSDGSSKQVRRRRRLVDRLDAPSNNADTTSDHNLSDAPENVTTVLKAKSSRIGQSKPTRHELQDQKLQRSMVVSSEGSQHSQNRANWTTKPRTTYATQRSHLSDMVDDLDGLGATSSQKSTEELVLQMPTSAIASQLELEDESDDQIGAGRLKSIHELRQAGANNRFDREIDALLEDIDCGLGSSKSLRLQALMKLVTKLKEATFVRHLANSGRMLRLTSLTTQPLDLPTSVLLMTAYYLLAGAETMSLDTVSRLLSAATALAPSMLVDDRSLLKIAKDRKQNLSKAMVNDLDAFGKTYNNDNGLPVSADHLQADLIALSCLDCILRRLVQLGDTSARLSTSLYTTILQLLQSHQQLLKDKSFAPTALPKLEIILTLLELCSLFVDDADLHVADSEYEALGDTLTEIIHQTSSLDGSPGRSVLRVVVSLSNNRPRMCKLLGRTDINKAAFGIINDNFLELARQAESEQSLDELKLDSVVLALGCLLNFAECDVTLRVRLSQMPPGEKNSISQLVSIFNTQVLKVDEAMTKEQSQVSVALGYLSMLLCTLSLHPALKDQVIQQLHNKSFDGLCAAAVKFFTHLRTLEHISEDDASMGSFTARFSAILDTVRGVEV